MTLTPVNIDSFGGLSLADPGEVGLNGAIDLLNVDLDRDGQVRQRDGYRQWTETTPTNALVKIWAVPYGTGRWVFADDSAMKLSAWEPSTVSSLPRGALVGSLSTAGAAAVTSVVPIGTATASRVYAFNGVAAETRKFDGASWATVSITNGGIAAVQTPDNRLAVNNTTNPSRVAFSDAGAPETFGANNYVDLHPGTGGAITAMAAWRDQLFVFKRDRYFVFYGNSSDSAGDPVFNYRAVVCRTGPANMDGVAIGPNGVYFADADSGVYVTTGGPPVKLSRTLDRVFRGTSSSHFAIQRTGTAVLSYAYGRLYLYGPSGGTLVYLIDGDRWLKWSWSTAYKQMNILEAGDPADGVFGGVFLESSSQTIHKMDAAVSTDNGSAISSYYRSGFGDVGRPGQEKTVRQTEVAGTGTVGLSWARDFEDAPTVTNVMLGTSPDTARGLQRVAQRGELLGFYLSSVSGGAWSVNRVTPMLRDPTGTGTRSDDA